MSDSETLLHDSDPSDGAAEVTREQAIPGFQSPSKSRYRPSEAWALRWLGNPAPTG